MITEEQFRRATGCMFRHAADNIQGLNDALEIADIRTGLRQAAFLAQIGHETDGFRAFTEYASGAAYDTGRLAQRLGNTPEDDGDGELYKGRGAIMVTGKRNYKLFEDWLAKKGIFIDLLAHPERVADPDLRFLAAAWYWEANNLNALADVGDFDTITKRINGGLNGKADRYRRHSLAKGVLCR